MRGLALQRQSLLPYGGGVKWKETVHTCFLAVAVQANNRNNIADFLDLVVSEVEQSHNPFPYGGRHGVKNNRNRIQNSEGFLYYPKKKADGSRGFYPKPLYKSNIITFDTDNSISSLTYWQSRASGPATILPRHGPYLHVSESRTNRIILTFSPLRYYSISST